MADDRERETERTTIVKSDGDGRGSAALVIALIALLLVLAALFFGGIFDRDEDEDLNVQLNQPGVNVIMPPETLPPVTTMPMPDVQAPPPDINVNVTTPPAELPEENLTNTEIGNTG